MLKVELGIASREYNDQDTIRRFNMGETYQGNNMVSTNSFNDMNNTQKDVKVEERYENGKKIITITTTMTTINNNINNNVGLNNLKSNCAINSFSEIPR